MNANGKSYLFRQTYKTVIILSLLLGACVAIAQGPGSYPTITGSVTDPEGAVIPGVQITAENTDRHSTIKATTNWAGMFKLAPLAVGHYVIRAKSRDWILKEPVKVTIEVSSNVTLVLKMERKGKRK